VAADRRQKLQNHLASRGISTGIHYPIALPNLKAYAYLKHTKDDFPVSSAASQEIVSLPLYAELDADQIRYICDAVREAL
jgi:dTDP-4-amino-4,6-dideoxygalactose transaminase